jgi:hypothetical protein
MKPIIIFFTFAILNPVLIKAQTAEDSIKAVVNNVFTAMKTSDAALLKTCFTDSAIMQTILRNKENIVSIKNESVEEFVSAIGAAKKGSLDERITFDMIRNDGLLATVWTPYSFYYEGNFSHCGINSFQLVNTHNGWKIQYIVDTRKRTGCN